MQTAEDARAIAVKRQDEEILTSERSAAADSELRAENGRTAAQAETNRIAREAADAKDKAAAEAARITRNNDEKTLFAQAEAERIKRDTDAQRMAAKTEADRLKLENDARMLRRTGRDRSRGTGNG